MISYFLANYILGYINIYTWVDTTFRVLVWGVVIAIVVTNLLMYAEKEKITDAFKYKILSEKAGDLLVSLIFYVIQLILMNLVTFAFVGYAVYMLFGIGPVLYAIIAYGIIFNVAATGHYMAQLEYETIGYNKEDFTPAK
ncbi:hypothetical protein SDC9_212067 [bioreactor metagenome]|uniref:Uncharacterized protein n=1 Tax=bioreactor metagenome TaxID=1076179 RepID=A0A645JLL2_9ZZZZ